MSTHIYTESQQETSFYPLDDNYKQGLKGGCNHLLGLEEIGAEEGGQVFIRVYKESNIKLNIANGDIIFLYCPICGQYLQ